MTNPLTALDIASVLPFIILCVFGMLVLLLEVFQRPGQTRAYLSYVTVMGFVLAGAAGYLLRDVPGELVFHDMNYLDGFSKVTALLMCTAGALTALIAPRYLQEQLADRGEFYALLLFSAGGMITMVSAADFLSFFLALELMSIAVYALAAYVRRSSLSSEAGLKYFLLGAFASAVMLYGIALIYGATGTTNLAAIGRLLAAGEGASGIDAALLLGQLSYDGVLAGAAGFDPGAGAVRFENFAGTGASLPLLYLGIVLVLVSAVFKVGAVPFHMWLPDAYTGAPTPVVAFMASAVKAAAFGALVRLLVLSFFGEELRTGAFGWVPFFFVIALLSIVLGNLAAIAQTNVKRMLAYSSIAHTGYLLVAITAMGLAGDIDLAGSVVFYLFAYAFATIGAFGILAYLTRQERGCETYDDLDGVGLRYPWIGLAMAVFMFSSAGLPPAAGFIAKLQVFMAGIDAYQIGHAEGIQGASMMLWLVVAGVLLSLTGVYYYLKVLVHMFMRKGSGEVRPVEHGGTRFAIAFCAVATVLIGVFPGRLIEISRDAVSQMGGRFDGVYERSETLGDVDNVWHRMGITFPE